MQWSKVTAIYDGIGVCTIYRFNTGKTYGQFSNGGGFWESYAYSNSLNMPPHIASCVDKLLIQHDLSVTLG